MIRYDFDENVEPTVTGTPDDNGQIKFRLVYALNSREIWYISDETRAKMIAAGGTNYSEYLQQINEFAEENELVAGVDYPLISAGNSGDWTPAAAAEMVQADLEQQLAQVSNNYTLTEVDVNDDDMLVDETYGNGVSITIESDKSWLRPADGDYWSTDGWTNASYATLAEVTNNYKKITVDVTKIDGYSNDNKAHGDATFDGAVFQLYADDSCTTKATVYDENGNAFEAGTYVTENGTFETDYLRTKKLCVACFYGKTGAAAQLLRTCVITLLAVT